MTRLLTQIVNSSNPIAESNESMTATASMSAKTESVPIVSKSHCTNSRKRPACGFSPRHTGAIWYRLKGVPSFGTCFAANLASGTVRSKRMPTSRPPLSLNR